MRIVVAVAVCVMSCKQEAPPVERGSASAPVVVVDAAAVVVDAPVPKQATKQQLVDFRKRIRAAWAAQKAKRWADAVTELEAALAILDGDPRALSELGWSAMNAGDFVKARKADEAAIRAAVDPKLKAASLYNLGMVQLKLGDKDGALRSFLTSLQLRANKTVEKQVAALGASPQAEPLFCEAGQTACYCVELDALDAFEKEDPDLCKKIKSPVAGFETYAVQTPGGELHYLLDEKNQKVAIIGGDDQRSRHFTTYKIAKQEIKNVGGHRVLWLEIETRDAIQWMNDENVEDEVIEERTVTVCAIGDAKAPTKCAVREVPLTSKHTIEHSKMSEDGDLTPGKEITTEVALDVTLADDGTVTVKLRKGSANSLGPNVLGPHRLW